MSRIKAIFDRDIRIVSTMMVHESGSKFYEVLSLSGKPSDSFKLLSLTRWGKISNRDSGGSWGKGKVITSSLGLSRYNAAIVNSKTSRGYAIEEENIISVERLRDLGFSRVCLEDSVSKFLEQFGIDVPALEQLDADYQEAIKAPEPEAPIVRSPLYGSW